VTVKLEDIRTLFIMTTLVVGLVVASPALGIIVPFGGSSEQFSELWLLGPDHMAEGYPFNVSEGEGYSVFVGVGNHMGGSQYYRVCVKLGNGSEVLPDIDGGVPSSLSPVYEYRFFVGDGEVWESAVAFGFEDVAIEGTVLSIGEVVVDGEGFPVDASTVWDPDKEGYLLVLFFELWRYDMESNIFRFDDRFVGLWLNMTASSGL
jgi:uncharacterized membrane protein